MKVSFFVILLLSLSCSLMARVLFEKPIYVSGEEGYHTFRIPALYETQNGVLLAFAEGRKYDWRDHGNINTILKRSFDGGQNWTDLQVIWDDGDNTCGNPTVVQDKTNGRIWLFMTHNYGQDTLRSISDGTSQGVRTIWSCYSDDDGATWSEPVNRFDQVQPADTRWDATGPGRGIQLQAGNRAGRLVIPAIGRNIQSDDNGATWHQSAWMESGSSEAQAVEIQGGTILRNDRATGSNRNYNARIFCRSYNQGASWTPLQIKQDLTCPICQASTIAVSSPAGLFGRKLVFSNPSSVNREKMSVQYSYDDGVSWQIKKVIYPGASAYSCLSPIGDNHIGLLYENGDNYTTAPQLYKRITFAKFSRDWIKDKAIVTWDFEDYQIGEYIPEEGLITDKRGYGLDAEAEADFAVVPGSFGKSSAIRFSGNGKGVKISDAESRRLLNFDNEDSFTLRVIFRTTSHCSGAAAGSGALISKDVGAGQKSWWLRIQDGRLRLFLDDGSSSASVWGQQNVCDGKWYEALISRNAQSRKLQIFINGQLDNESVDNTNYGFVNTNPVSIGCFNIGTSSFNGDIAMAQVYRTTADNVITVFNGDLNYNGVVNIKDLKILANNWLERN